MIFFLAMLTLFVEESAVGVASAFGVGVDKVEEESNDGGGGGVLPGGVWGGSSLVCSCLSAVCSSSSLFGGLGGV